MTPDQVTPAQVTVRLRRDYAHLVTLAEEEPLLTGLRRRGLIVDSARIRARDARAAGGRDDSN